MTVEVGALSWLISPAFFTAFLLDLRHNPGAFISETKVNVGSVQSFSLPDNA